MAQPLTRVRVLRRAKFNGENHKTLGWLEPGDIAEVPTGLYLDSLIEDGYVEVCEKQNQPEVPDYDLDEFKINDLRKMANANGISDTHRMTKDELKDLFEPEWLLTSV